MKKYQVIGVVRSNGSNKDEKTGQEFSWDNILLHCMVEDDRQIKGKEIYAGFETAVLKCKNNFAEIVSVRNAPIKNFAELCGCKIRAFYNEYGNIDCIEVMDV